MATLFLIPTSLTNPINQVGILEHQINEIKHLKYFIVETAKIGRLHIKQLNTINAIQELSIQELNKHKQNIAQLVNPLINGHDIGLLSDCGMPGVADPGNVVVIAAQNLLSQSLLKRENHTDNINNIRIKPLAGTSSLLMALMASGLNGQNFAFTGYLPIDHKLRQSRIQELERLIIKTKQSQIIIETPFRNTDLLNALINTLSNNIKLSISVNLMCTDEYTMSLDIKTWKQIILPNVNKQEVVFVIGS
jgi:16S rRNA (cytidine1402-2'-O)-methyltransferase